MTDQVASLPPTFHDDVAQALKAWRSDASQDSPLGYLFLVRTALTDGSVSPRQATNEVLLRALEMMAENYDREAEVLRLRFLNGELVYTVEIVSTSQSQQCIACKPRRWITWRIRWPAWR